MKSVKLSFIALIVILTTEFVYAEPTQEALSLQEAFINVAKEVGPAVVSISTEHTERFHTVYYPFSRFEDEFFQDFFNDFFITGPEREFKRRGLGSGVIIDKKGHILTNEHVVKDADRITVTLPDGREFDAHLTGSDTYSDLAIIKIDPAGEDLPFARLGDSDKLQIGQWAIAIGNPFGYAVKNPEPTVTVGVIGALNRSLPRTDKRVREYSDLIQTDAAINPGNSGGPLLDIDAKVIGINVAILTLSGGSEGIGFAVPINTAKRIMEDLIEGREVLYGWLGVIIQDIDADIAGYFGLKDTQGVLISRVVTGGPAEKAGLRPGDIVVSLDNEKIKNTRDLIRKVLKKDIGETANVELIRNRAKNLIKVEIGVRPGEKTARVPLDEDRKTGKEELNGNYWRGMEVADITSDMISRLDLDRKRGVIVTNVDPLGPAREAGIRKGDLIYEIDRIPIRNTDDFRNAIKKVSGDVLVGTYRGYVVIKE